MNQDRDTNVVCLCKGEERYIFLYEDNHRLDVIRTLGRFAANPELSFTWHDAVQLSIRVHQMKP